MNEKSKEFCNKVWNEEARRQLEAELNFMSKEKIELPKGKDYLELFAKTHKTDEEIMEEKDKEIERLNNIINELEEWINDSTKWYVDLVHSYIKDEPLIFVKDLKNKLKELKEKSDKE